jgi:LCP family protein required for cell wall assembly
MFRTLSLSLAIVIGTVASVGSIVLWKIQSSIASVSLGDVKLSGIAEMKGAFNVLIIGSDTREGLSSGFGDISSALNDVNIVVHVSADHTRATAVSIPRDLIVPIPECPYADGTGSYAAMTAQPINSALSYGGLPCVVLTIEALTGLDIQYAGLITFDGVAQLATAVGGVDVCVNGPINDPYTGLTFPAAGTYSVQGWQALAFLRTRHGVGDGSDLGRISSQQVYLSSLVRKIQDEGVLYDPTKVYGLASVAAHNMTLSTSLAGVDTMAAMALVLKDIPRDRITFVQYPGTTGLGGIYENKVAPLTTLADELFAAIASDAEFSLDENATGVGSTLEGDTATPSPTATSTPSPTVTTSGTPTPTATDDGVLHGIQGQTADQKTCSVAN